MKKLLLIKERPISLGRSFVLVSILFFCSSSVYSANTAVDQRLNRLERLLDNQNLSQMLNSLQELQREVSELRGEVELLTFEIGKIKKQQKDIYLDLDQRIQQVDQAVANIGFAPSGDGSGDETLEAGSVDEAEPGETLGEQESYQAALNILKSGRYEDAIQSYQLFLITYPESSFASNAQYWMAEAYYVLKEFASAITHFQKVISAYPNSRKVSDAYLKIGFSHYELKEWVKAQAALEKVITDYSSSTASRLAQRRLQKMKLAGNI